MASVKWIKIVVDIFDDEKMLLIDAMPDRDAIIVIWFKLLCMAGRQNNDGIFMLNDKVAYTDEMLSYIFRRPIATVRLALKAFEEFGMIRVVDDAITIPNWEKHQNTEQLKRIREGNRQRKADERARARLSVGGKTVNKRDQVRQYAALHPDSTNTEIAKALGISRTTVIKHLSGTNTDVTALPDARAVTVQPNAQLNTPGVQLDAQLNTQGVQLDTVQAVQLNVQLDSTLNTKDPKNMGKTAGRQCSENVTRDSRVTHANVTPLDEDKDIDKESSTSKMVTPTLEEVTAFFVAAKLPTDPQRFFSYNERRQWTLKNGKPVDDWQGLAKTWAAHEKTPAKKSVLAPTPVFTPPSVEEIMAKRKVDRVTAEAMLQEDLY